MATDLTTATSQLQRVVADAVAPRAPQTAAPSPARAARAVSHIRASLHALSDGVPAAPSAAADAAIRTLLNCAALLSPSVTRAAGTALVALWRLDARLRAGAGSFVLAAVLPGSASARGTVTVDAAVRAAALRVATDVIAAFPDLFASGADNDVIAAGLARIFCGGGSTLSGGLNLAAGLGGGGGSSVTPSLEERLSAGRALSVFVRSVSSGGAASAGIALGAAGIALDAASTVLCADGSAPSLLLAATQLLWVCARAGAALDTCLSAAAAALGDAHPGVRVGAAVALAHILAHSVDSAAGVGGGGDLHSLGVTGVAEGGLGVGRGVGSRDDDASGGVGDGDENGVAVAVGGLSSDEEGGEGRDGVRDDFGGADVDDDGGWGGVGGVSVDQKAQAPLPRGGTSGLMSFALRTTGGSRPPTSTQHAASGGGGDDDGTSQPHSSAVLTAAAASALSSSTLDSLTSPTKHRRLGENFLKAFKKSLNGLGSGALRDAVVGRGTDGGGLAHAARNFSASSALAYICTFTRGAGRFASKRGIRAGDVRSAAALATLMLLRLLRAANRVTEEDIPFLIAQCLSVLAHDVQRAGALPALTHVHVSIGALPPAGCHNEHARACVHQILWGGFASPGAGEQVRYARLLRVTLAALEHGGSDAATPPFFVGVGVAGGGSSAGSGGRAGPAAVEDTLFASMHTVPVPASGAPFPLTEAPTKGGGATSSSTTAMTETTTRSPARSGSTTNNPFATRVQNLASRLVGIGPVSGTSASHSVSHSTTAAAPAPANVVSSMGTSASSGGPGGGDTAPTLPHSSAALSPTARIAALEFASRLLPKAVLSGGAALTEPIALANVAAAALASPTAALRTAAAHALSIAAHVTPALAPYLLNAALRTAAASMSELSSPAAAAALAAEAAAASIGDAHGFAAQRKNVAASTFLRGGVSARADTAAHTLCHSGASPVFSGGGFGEPGAGAGAGCGVVTGAFARALHSLHGATTAAAKIIRAMQKGNGAATTETAAMVTNAGGDDDGEGAAGSLDSALDDALALAAVALAHRPASSGAHSLVGTTGSVSATASGTSAAAAAAASSALASSASVAALAEVDAGLTRAGTRLLRAVALVGGAAYFTSKPRRWSIAHALTARGLLRAQRAMSAAGVGAARDGTGAFAFFPVGLPVPVAAAANLFAANVGSVGGAVGGGSGGNAADSASADVADGLASARAAYAGLAFAWALVSFAAYAEALSSLVTAARADAASPALLGQLVRLTRLALSTATEAPIIPAAAIDAAGGTGGGGRGGGGVAVLCAGRSGAVIENAAAAMALRFNAAAAIALPAAAGLNPTSPPRGLAVASVGGADAEAASDAVVRGTTYSADFCAWLYSPSGTSLAAIALARRAVTEAATSALEAAASLPANTSTWALSLRRPALTAALTVLSGGALALSPLDVGLVSLDPPASLEARTAARALDAVLEGSHGRGPRAGTSSATLPDAHDSAVADLAVAGMLEAAAAAGPTWSPFTLALSFAPPPAAPSAAWAPPEQIKSLDTEVDELEVDDDSLLLGGRAAALEEESEDARLAASLSEVGGNITIADASSWAILRSGAVVSSETSVRARAATAAISLLKASVPLLPVGTAAAFVSALDALLRLHRGARAVSDGQANDEGACGFRIVARSVDDADTAVLARNAAAAFLAILASLNQGAPWFIEAREALGLGVTSPLPLVRRLCGTAMAELARAGGGPFAKRLVASLQKRLAQSSTSTLDAQSRVGITFAVAAARRALRDETDDIVDVGVLLDSARDVRLPERAAALYALAELLRFSPRATTLSILGPVFEIIELHAAAFPLDSAPVDGEAILVDANNIVAEARISLIGSAGNSGVSAAVGGAGGATIGAFATTPKGASRGLIPVDHVAAAFFARAPWGECEMLPGGGGVAFGERMGGVAALGDAATATLRLVALANRSKAGGGAIQSVASILLLPVFDPSSGDVLPGPSALLLVPGSHDGSSRAATRVATVATTLRTYTKTLATVGGAPAARAVAASVVSAMEVPRPAGGGDALRRLAAMNDGAAVGVAISRLYRVAAAAAVASGALDTHRAQAVSSFAIVAPAAAAASAASPPAAGRVSRDLRAAATALLNSSALSSVSRAVVTAALESALSLLSGGDGADVSSSVVATACAPRRAEAAPTVSSHVNVPNGVLPVELPPLMCNIRERRAVLESAQGAERTVRAWSASRSGGRLSGVDATVLNECVEVVSSALRSDGRDDGVTPCAPWAPAPALLRFLSAALEATARDADVDVPTENALSQHSALISAAIEPALGASAPENEARAASGAVLAALRSGAIRGDAATRRLLLAAIAGSSAERERADGPRSQLLARVWAWACVTPSARSTVGVMTAAFPRLLDEWAAVLGTTDVASSFPSLVALNVSSKIGLAPSVALIDAIAIDDETAAAAAQRGESEDDSPAATAASLVSLHRLAAAAAASPKSASALEPIHTLLRATARNPRALAAMLSLLLTTGPLVNVGADAPERRAVAAAIVGVARTATAIWKDALALLPPDVRTHLELSLREAAAAGTAGTALSAVVSSGAAAEPAAATAVPLTSATAMTAPAAVAAVSPPTLSVQCPPPPTLAAPKLSIAKFAAAAAAAAPKVSKDDSKFLAFLSQEDAFTKPKADKVAAPIDGEGEADGDDASAVAATAQVAANVTA